MNREELSKIKVEGLENGLPKEVIDELMRMNGSSIEALKKENEKLTTEKGAIETQLNDANEKIKGFAEIDVEKIKGEVDEWKTKYETDTQNLKDTLSKTEYDYKVKDLTSGLKFSSESARKSFIRDLEEKGLKLEEDKILGFDDFVNSYKESDPNAFISETKEPENNGFVANTGETHTVVSGDPSKMDYDTYKQWRSQNN